MWTPLACLVVLMELRAHKAPGGFAIVRKGQERFPCLFARPEILSPAFFRCLLNVAKPTPTFLFRDPFKKVDPDPDSHLNEWALGFEEASFRLRAGHPQPQGGVRHRGEAKNGKRSPHSIFTPSLLGNV